MGYHFARIKKGELGELSKVREELEEALDAYAQGVEIMILLELSDLVGAIDAYLKKHHPSLDLVDLVRMAQITARAFESGDRK